MGRIVDLCGEIAAAAEEGADGLVLPPDVWERLRADWDDEDIEDAMGLVHDSLLQAELVESADSLSARLIEVLGAFGTEAAFKSVAADAGALTLEAFGQLTRRVARLEEILEDYREGASPDRRGFDALQRRLADHGLEDEMEEGAAEADAAADLEDDGEEES
jgi:hypothetical protein